MGEFEIHVTDRVVRELNKRGIKQGQLLAQCREIGMPLSQPDISKIYSGKKTLNMYQLAAVSKALGLPADLFLWGREGQREDFCNPHDSRLLCGSGDELECYKGRFSFYYISTAANEDKIISGELNIDKSDGFFDAVLELDTKEKDSQGNRIKKKYVGRLMVSLALGAAYLIFKSEPIGEMCMICLRHRRYNVKDMECRVGLALTVSAGEIKEPTAHKCLLVRRELSDRTLEELRPWLSMTGNDFSIETGKLDKIIGQLTEKYPEYAEEIQNIKKHAVVRTYVELGADILCRQMTMNRKDFVDLLIQLYSVSNVKRNYVVSQAEDIWFYEKMMELSSVGGEDAVS